MVGFGTVGTVLSAIDLLRDVLEKSGVDRSKAAQIVGDFVSKWRPRGGAGEGAARKGDVSPAFKEDVWEFRVLTLAYEKPRRGTKSLVVRLIDGRTPAGVGSADLAAYLNRAGEDGWDIVTSLGGEQAPTVILKRLKD